MGSITGVPASNIADKLWLVFQALGDIAFAYPYSVLILEIQVTLISKLWWTTKKNIQIIKEKENNLML